VRDRFLKENILDNRLVNRWTSKCSKGDQGAVFKVTIAPKVNRSSVAVIVYVLAMPNANRREQSVIDRRRDKARANR
jgi:hypothetical protein